MSSELYTVCFWAGYEAMVSEAQGGGSRRTRLHLGRESQRRYGGNTISARFTRELHLFNV